MPPGLEPRRNDMTPFRDITWVVDVSDIEPLRTYSDALETTLYPARSFIQFGATDWEPPFRLEIVENFDHMSPDATEGVLVIRGSILDPRPENRELLRGDRTGTIRHIFPLDRTTRLTNREIMGPRLGTGLAYDAWYQSARAETAQPGADPRDVFYESNHFVYRVLRHPTLFGPSWLVPDEVWEIGMKGWLWTSEKWNYGRNPIRTFFHEVEPESGPGVDRTVFTLDELSRLEKAPLLITAYHAVEPVNYADQWSYLARGVRARLGIEMLPEYLNLPRASLPLIPGH